MSKRPSFVISSPVVRACLLSALSLVLGAKAVADPVPVTIMPLGDSITLGSGGTADYGGYRGTLYTLLTNAGYAPDFVGTQTGNSAQIPDPNHQGHSGWRIDQLDTNVEGWLSAIAAPNFILLHIGTNDFGQNYNINTAIDRLDALILKMATLRPNANIIVTNLMERGGTANTNIVNLFNPYVPGLVDAHAAAGRKVTFLDMRSKVPLADMPDSLHPNQTGYNKMAAAWLEAIDSVVSPPDDPTPPTVVLTRHKATPPTGAVVRFSKAVADSAANVANYSIPGLTVTGASLSADYREVTLVTSTQTPGTTYTITLNNIVDRRAEPAAMAPNTTTSFLSPLPRGYAVNAPESAGYTLLQAVELPVVSTFGASAVPYSVDNRAYIAGFDRVAYYLELELPDGTFQYVWASMDAFTSNVNHLGLPTYASAAVHERGVTNMTVATNVPGVQQGTGLTGNLEFWPNDYSGAANSGIGSTGTAFDFDDTRSAGGTFGSMQVHNTLDKKTVFAINDWGQTTSTSSVIEVGIGNQPTGNPDWTHANNGAQYTMRRLYVLVRAAGDLVSPTVLSATASHGLARLYVDFSEPVQPLTTVAGNFTLSHGVTVLGAELSPNGRQVVLTTTLMPEGQALTLTVNGVRDTSPAANIIATNTTAQVTLPAIPAEVTAAVGTAANGYQLVYSIDLPQVGNLIAQGSKAYSWDDSAATQPFSRVAYFLETQRPGAASQYVWVSMKAFTNDRKKVGIPTAASKAVFQTLVSEMDVQSNVSGVTTGSNIATGNIEFWPTDYTAPNGLPVPGADVTKYDFGDTRSSTGSFGSMQVHNHGAAAHTVFAINHWGADGSTLDVGIGTNPTASASPDWTNAANAGTFYKRRLHVLVLPGVPELPTQVAADVPEAQGYQLVYTLNIPARGNLTPPTYAVNNAAQLTTPFRRIAYYMELKKGATREFVWVSADSFTADPLKIGVPTTASGAVFQQVLSNMNVVSNHAGVTQGTNLATGNIEFWPTNYSQVNEKMVPGANDATYDFGDTRTTTGSHGSMQIHNHMQPGGHTLFSITNWGSTGDLLFGLGIGNCPAPKNGGVDWTFADNSNTYDSRVLHVLVLPGDGDFVRPTLATVTGAMGRNQVALTFSEPVAESTVLAGNFTIPGLTVTGAKLMPGQRDVVLTTSTQTAGSSYTVTVAGVRDLSAQGNLVAVGTAGTFTAPVVPARITSIPEAAGYELVHQVAIPATVPTWNVNPVPYSVDEPKFRPAASFDRVAYVLELDDNWVFAAFDRHTAAFNKLGIPTLSVTSTPFQAMVSNLTVASNVAGIVTGNFPTGGNIEFWGGNYNGTNTTGVPNATNDYDWGDRMDPGGYGTLQVHNHGQSQVLLAYNNWGNASGSTVGDIGIGNRNTVNRDWTMSYTANTYTKRNLYVLVRPAAPTGTGPVILASPASRTVSLGGSATLGVTVQNATAGMTYQWRRNGTAIPTQTLPWLELTNITGAQTGNYDVVVTGENLISSTSAAAALTLDGTNQPPTFSGYQISTPMNTAAVIPVASLLAHASDLDGDTLDLDSAGPASAQGGSVATASGNVTYVPASGHVGADSFAAVIVDGRGGFVNGTVQVTVIGNTALPKAGAPVIGRRADGKVDLAFQATVGVQYDIRRNLTLDPEGWSTVATVTAGNDGVVPFIDPNPPADRAFYRIEPHVTPP